MAPLNIEKYDTIIYDVSGLRGYSWIILHSSEGKSRQKARILPNGDYSWIGERFDTPPFPFSFYFCCVPPYRLKIVDEKNNNKKVSTEKFSHWHSIKDIKK